MQTTYRPALDGVRTLCIALTLANHVKGWPANIFVNFGVDIFFALSGWLITFILLREGVNNRIHIVRFYIRRAFRILPLYYLVILTYSVLAVFLGKDRPDLLLLTLNPEYRLSGTGGLVGHAWTLGIEEKFYVIWPALLLCFARRPWVAWSIALLAAFLLTALGHFDDHIVRGYCGLGFGSTLALAAHTFPGFARLIGRRYLAETAAAGLIVPILLGVYLPGAVWNVCISAVAAVVVASLWLGWQGPLSQLLSARPLPFLGTLTYAFYLFHILVLNVCEGVLHRVGVRDNPVVTLVLAYCATICVVWPMHRFLEVPLINLGKKLASRTKVVSAPSSSLLSSDKTG